MKTLLASILFLTLAGIPASAEDYPEIDMAALEKAMAENAVTLIDANGTRTWSKRHIPGAIDFKARAKEIATDLPDDKGALIVTYCGGPGCQLYLPAAEAVKKLGYTNVRHLPDGIVGWIQAGKKTEAAKD